MPSPARPHQPPLDAGDFLPVRPLPLPPRHAPDDRALVIVPLRPGRERSEGALVPPIGRKNSLRQGRRGRSEGTPAYRGDEASQVMRVPNEDVEGGGGSGIGASRARVRLALGRRQAEPPRAPSRARPIAPTARRGILDVAALAHRHPPLDRDRRHERRELRPLGTAPTRRCRPCDPDPPAARPPPVVDRRRLGCTEPRRARTPRLVVVAARPTAQAVVLCVRDGRSFLQPCRPTPR